MAKLTLIYFDLNTGYYPSFNHGLAYLIGTLKSDNHKISLIHLKDENSFDKIPVILERENPDLIGLSFTTNQKKYVHRFFNIGKLPTRLIIAGGAHCTIAKDEVFQDFPQLDGICVGDGEIPLKELCRRLDANEDYLTTPSFYFKTPDKIIKNPVLPLTDIENLAFPDYSLFDYKKIIEDNNQSFPMILSRGCPYNCNYCCNHVFRQVYPNKEKYVRLLSVRHSMKIIKNNLSLYPLPKMIVFADDTFTISKKWMFEFCKAYKNEINLPFSCNARINTIDDQIVQYLKLGGCVSLSFGVESGNEWLRKYIMNRNYTNKEIIETFKITKKYGLTSFSYNMVGFPFETQRMVRDTVNLNLEIKSNSGKCFYFYPYPGTVLYQLCKDYNLLLDGIEMFSGYLESPAIKEIFMTHKEIKKHFELLNIYFYLRLVFSKIKIHSLLEKMFFKIVLLFRKLIFTFLVTITHSENIIALKRKIRTFVLKYLSLNTITSIKHIVFIEKLEQKIDSIENQFIRSFELLSLNDDFQRANAIFIKPNLTYPVYKQGVTTRKEFVENLVAALRQINTTTKIYIGEGEGGYNSFSMSDALRNMGFEDIANKYPQVKVINLSKIPSKKVTIDTLKGPYEISLPEIFFNEINFSITCPVPKVHCMTKITLAYKNQWGCLPDIMRLKNHYMFDYLISKIADILKFKYAFLDGKYGLDNNGPMMGDPVEVNWFAASNSLGAFDMIVSEMMGFDWKKVGYLRIAKKYGFIPKKEEIGIIGDINLLKKKFVLKRILWNYPALIAFHSKLLTQLFYFSGWAKPLHDIMYMFRKRPIG